MASQSSSQDSSGTESSYSPDSLQGHFLISMPHMDDHNFDHTVTFICDHNEYGAMGIVVNRPLELELDALLQQLDMSPPPELASVPVYAGGPVQCDRGFILHRPNDSDWTSSFAVSDQLSLTTSTDILAAIADSNGPDEYLVALGYAGWGAGQLEQELIDNVWLSCPANLDIMFRTPAAERLQAAASSLGVNLDLLTGQSGHA